MKRAITTHAKDFVAIIALLSLSSFVAFYILNEQRLRFPYLEPAPFETARWISAETKADLEEFMSANRGGMSEDRDGSPVFLARNAWELGYIAEKSPKVKFSSTMQSSWQASSSHTDGLPSRPARPVSCM